MYEIKNYIYIYLHILYIRKAGNMCFSVLIKLCITGFTVFDCFYMFLLFCLLIKINTKKKKKHHVELTKVKTGETDSTTVGPGHG